MANTRADRIFEIIEKGGGRLKVKDIHKQLSTLEGIQPEDISPATVPATVRQDNKVRSSSGKLKRFNFFGDGDEVRSYISIIRQVKPESSKTKILGDYAAQIPAVIEEANQKASAELKKAIQRMSWQEFESSFLLQILEALGFSQVEITKRTRDGGKDAYCTYKRGLVQSQAIVSAKHWKSKVAAEEVQRIRGIKGEADTGVIFTSSSFSDDAVKEASPSQNQRAMVLIDGDLIVQTCFSNGIGVDSIKLPTLYKFVGISQDEEEI